ncbi:MAG TPA: hypothetical protein VFU22_06610 [Roseiflexaceae bacterium]|nr:hypothetical protein [Roseiflexaceae bacterium]
MPTQDDIAAQEALLQAHRQTLGVLLEQEAKIGPAYAPPAIANGIAEARAAIARAKRALREWGVAVDDLPDDQAPPAAAGAIAPQPWPAGAHSRGDMIVANIGAGAQKNIVGKNQLVYQKDDAASQQDDQQTIADLLEQLDRALAGGTKQIDGATAGMAAGYLRLLSGELSKRGERAVPSASTITLVGDWLLDSLPQLRDPLVALFAAPATRRALARADTPLDEWLRRRFGG